MLRLRRYRVYVAIAALALLLLYRMTLKTEWEGLPTSLDYNSSPKSKAESGHADQLGETNKLNQGEHDIQRKRPKQGKEEETIQIPDLKTNTDDDSGHVNYGLPTTTAQRKTTLLDDYEKTTPAPAAEIVIPDRKTPHQEWQEKEDKAAADQGHDKQKVQTQQHKTVTTTTTSIAHWQKPDERFRISSESIIPLPTGKPKAIPRIQHAFKEESEVARDKREERLFKVTAEMKRAWTGYKSYAWMHDELSPVTQKFRDPFCGWAATLVDALDTLWIMGMKEEFEEAVRAIGKIDFTTTPRTEIPVFETTIRYLGGLLGAYDVSGGAVGGYDILLGKAVELAEILMGIFDTPNRMPILYYNWKPTDTKKFRRAAAGVSVAELGSLSMEFTRLAQLTQDNKYYDAVARITDAFEEWQSRPGGTAIAGIFPERVDAAGCNRTAARDAELKLSEEAAEKVQSVVKNTPDDYTGREYSHDEKTIVVGKPISQPEFPSTDQKGDSSKSETQALHRRRVLGDEEDPHDRPLTVKEGSAPGKGKLNTLKHSLLPDLYERMMTDKVTGEPYVVPELESELCYPQGLDSAGWGMDSYGMGGSQDSTYEYFPKQFLLLGGLETKYRDMHLQVVDAVKKWLLYRPMVPDSRDILFSAKVNTRGKPEEDLLTEFEVTHLTCFLGGMFGMAGKIFEEPIDVEIGKKLTDGCVWAYETMPTGIMPEGATVVPCAVANNCPWNETIWWQYLDPLWNTRDAQIEDYQKREEEEKQKKKAVQAALRRVEEPVPVVEVVAVMSADKEDGTAKTITSSGDESTLNSNTREEQTIRKSEAMVEKEVSKRGLDTDTEEQLETSSNDNAPPTKTTKQSALEDSLDMNIAGGLGKVAKPIQAGGVQFPLADDEVDDEDSRKPDPSRPLSHQEYVDHRIKNEKMPPGFVSVNARRYILRPEAIESVWYMWRITGDTAWQDKGWRMFEAIIAATQTEAGHSAIQDVMNPGSDKVNEMESFWLAETLKYFYLLYSTPDVISLDDWVLNTEAHPFKRPSPS